MDAQHDEGKVEGSWLPDPKWPVIFREIPENADWRVDNPLGVPRVPRTDPQVSIPERALGVNLDRSPSNFEELLLQTCCPPSFPAILARGLTGVLVSTMDIPDMEGAVHLAREADMRAALDDMHAKGGRFLHLSWDPVRVQGRGEVVDLPRDPDPRDILRHLDEMTDLQASGASTAFSVMIPVRERRLFAGSMTYVATREETRTEVGIDEDAIRAAAAQILEGGRVLLQQCNTREMPGDPFETAGGRDPFDACDDLEIPETEFDMTTEDDAAIIPSTRWLAPLLAQMDITRFEASFSGGGDEGGLDDVLFYKSDATMASSEEVKTLLSGIALPDGSAHVQTAHDVFEAALYEATQHDGDYSNGEGGSLWAEFRVRPGGIVKGDVEFSYSEYDDEDYDEDDIDDEDPGDDVDPAP
jgi:hypothetical protein